MCPTWLRFWKTAWSWTYSARSGKTGCAATTLTCGGSPGRASGPAQAAAGAILGPKDAMHELRELLQGGPGNPGLDVAALQIATVEYPEIAPASFIEVLDSYGRELTERLSATADGEEFIHTMN